MGEVILGLQGLHLGAGLILGDRAGLEPILERAQAVAGAFDVGFPNAPPAICVQLKA